MTTKIFIQQLSGAMYQASLEDGEMLVKSSKQPLLDSCRVLKARGISGRVEMWDRVTPYYRMSGDIEEFAGLSVNEPDGRIPTFIPYRPYNLWLPSKDGKTEGES